MAKGYPVLRLSPEPFVGVVTDYSKEFVEKLKAVCSVRAWDGVTSTWWFPVSYEPFVVELLRELKLTNESELNRTRALIATSTKRGPVTEDIAAQYRVLGLDPSAPPVLVEWALYFWRKELGGIGAPTTKLLQVEEAHRLISGGKRVD